MKNQFLLNIAKIETLQIRSNTQSTPDSHIYIKNTNIIEQLKLKFIVITQKHVVYHLFWLSVIFEKVKFLRYLEA